MLPSAALMPPCAATVWDRVGKSFDTHAVFSPASVRPTAARSPAPPAPTTRALSSVSHVLYESVLVAELTHSDDQ